MMTGDARNVAAVLIEIGVCRELRPTDSYYFIIKMKA
jgi:hypothetical protein